MITLRSDNPLPAARRRRQQLVVAILLFPTAAAMLAAVVLLASMWNQERLSAAALAAAPVCPAGATDLSDCRYDAAATIIDKRVQTGSKGSHFYYTAYTIDGRNTLWEQGSTIYFAVTPGENVTVAFWRGKPVAMAVGSFAFEMSGDPAAARNMDAILGVVLVPMVSLLISCALLTARRARRLMPPAPGTALVFSAFPTVASRLFIAVNVGAWGVVALPAWGPLAAAALALCLGSLAWSATFVVRQTSLAIDRDGIVWTDGRQTRSVPWSAVIGCVTTVIGYGRSRRVVIVLSVWDGGMRTGLPVRGILRCTARNELLFTVLDTALAPAAYPGVAPGMAQA